jgi:ketosteroid isomerase-like protein
MGQAEVEFVANLIRRWGVNDRALELLHPDIEWDARAFPDGEVYRGREGVNRFLDGLVEPWEDYRLEFEELIDGGDCVVALTRESGRRDGSEFALKSVLAFWVEYGQLVRMRGWLDRAAGLEELGLAADAG